MAQLFTLPFVPALNLQGQFMGAATLSFYRTGTTTGATVYGDETLIVPIGNVVTADAFGRFPAIFLDESTIYRVILKSALGVVIGDIDGLNGVGVDTASVTASLAAEIARSTAAEGALGTRISSAEDGIATLQTEISSGIPQFSTWTALNTAFTQWLIGTTYSKGKFAQDQGAFWVYINATATAGHEPPTLPAASDDYWQIFALNPYTVSSQVPLTDTGTHTDPTNGASVANSGVYKWATGTNGTGWQWVSATAASQAEPFADAAAASAAAAEAAATSLAGLVASSQTSGTYPAVDGDTTITPGSTLYAADPITTDGAINGVSVYIPTGSTPGPATLLVAKDNGDGTVTRIPSLDQSVTVAVGANTFTNFNPSVSAGWLIGVYFSGNLRIQQGIAGKTSTSTTGLTGTSTAKIISNNSQPAVSYKATGGEVARAKGAEGLLQKQFDGSSGAGGQNPPAALSTTLLANFAGMCDIPTQSGSLTALCNLSGPTDAIAYLVTRDTNANITSIVKRQTFSGKAGANSIVMGAQGGGLYVMVLPKTASLTYQGTGGTGARDYPFAGEPTVAIFRTGTTTSGLMTITGLVATGDLAVGLSVVGTGIPINSTIASIDSTSQVTFTNSASAGATASGSPTITFGGKTSTLGVTSQVSIGWSVLNGTTPRLNALESAQATPQSSSLASAGYGLVDAADNTGVTDATTIFATARGTYPTPNVPPGTFSLTTWPYYGEGFWGPGIVNVGGVTVSLPIAPERGSRYLKMRASLMPQILSGACLILNGDSITTGYHASSRLTTWAALLTRFANLGIAIDDPVMGSFDDADTAGNLAFQGVTLANPTTATLGPNGPVKSLMLQVGQSISVTGAYDRVDATYTGVSGGILVFACNGTTYRTVTCSTAGSDLLAGGGATGQTAIGTYRITNTGSVAVEITSLMRFGVKVGGSPRRLNVCRFAHGGFKFTDYDANKIASMVRIANAVSSITGGGINHMLITELSTNDQLAGQNYATLKANAAAYIARFVTAGVPAASMVPLMPWRWSTYGTGTTYEDQLAAVRDAFKAAGAPRCIQTDAYDFIAQGLSGSDGHPVDSGELAMFNAAVTALSGGAL